MLNIYIFPLLDPHTQLPDDKLMMHLFSTKMNVDTKEAKRLLLKSSLYPTYDIPSQLSPYTTKSLPHPSHQGGSSVNKTKRKGWLCAPINKILLGELD